MKTMELKSEYYLVKFFSNSRRLLIYEDYLYVETFSRIVADFEALSFSVREAARCMSISSGRSVAAQIEHKVSSNEALKDPGHVYPCSFNVLTKFKVSLIRE